MARSSSKPQQAADRVKKLPWAAITGSVIAVLKRWRALSEKERRRLLELARESGVRPDRLSAKQRKELRRLLAKLDLKGMGGELRRALSAKPGRGRGRRRTS